MENTRRLLLFSWGNGSGHITRLLAIAELARRDEWEVVVVTHEHQLHLDLLKSADLAFVPYPEHLVPADLWACWSDGAFLDESIAFDQDVIRSVAPDYIVHDSRLATMIAARESGVPFASVCQEVQLPGFTYDGFPVGAIWTDPVDTVNARLARTGLTPVHADVRELYLLGRTLLPSIPEFDQVPEGLGAHDIVHVGPLQPVRADDSMHVRTPEGARRGEDGIFFYRTVGPATDLDQFAATFADVADNVYIATGSDNLTDRLTAEFRTLPFQVATFWNLGELRPKLRVAVVHGGHGMSLACVTTGLAAVVLPGNNPERSLNARRLAELGFAKVLGRDTSFAISWGASVDVTGEMPDWPAVRAAVDSMSRTGITAAAGALTERVRARMAKASISEMLGLDHAGKACS